ncbi:SDR family NAD(P)-dependent oxidoreductase [Actinomadura nitritigenes]|uniref:SDR family NAD(P)-dependent oxidoreductase n=1 Tax=Actinomadura nitritigenes TaxID=134602 RepID=A0ABS3RE56_9ACTN|nr:SDR family NAD(P)-dependent oxidoreductase [Actinomadura nitritigenes]
MITDLAGTSNSSAPGGPVAVIGIGCRFPGGIRSLDDLWEALVGQRDLVGEVPADRFDAAQWVSEGRKHARKSYSGAGAFLEDVHSFDAAFFEISPKEAAQVDPQQRLLLECAVEAFDDAGIDPAVLRGSDTAVIAGAAMHDYEVLQARRVQPAPYSMSGIAMCNLANRVSYFFDLHGPSHTVDTACSSSLLAVHQACQLLNSGRSPVALAGGVNVLVSPYPYLGFSQASMLSPTGRCRPFSARADGFVRAEGAAVVLLKPLREAERDGDRVLGVILASEANADGRTMGLTLPSTRAQAALLERVYARAGVAPAEVAYVEAHGTGTQAGDPVECRALGQVLGQRRDGAPLPIGSLKSNMGHLESAAGVAGLCKAITVLREGRIPANLHADPLSDEIDFTGLGLEPVTALRPLSTDDRRVVGVSSFGFGGANVHVVMAPPPPSNAVTQDADLRAAVNVRAEAREAGAGPAGAVPRRLPVLVSARTRQALDEAAEQWAVRLEKADEEEFYDISYTSCRRRAQHERRMVVLADGPKEAAAGLRSFTERHTFPRAASAEAVRHGRVAFVFGGNASQWVGMGGELLAIDPLFEAEVRAADKVLSGLLGWSVCEELAEPADPARWARTEVAQPLLFAVQAGLVAALAGRGVRPSAVAGHSVGEVAAAYCAGALDLAAACRVIAERSRAQAPTAGMGRMAAAGLSPEQAARWITEQGHGDRICIAGVNAARDVTLAGDPQALAAFGETLEDRGLFFRDLGLDYAFHSPAMDALHEPLRSSLHGLAPAACVIPLVSTVTGDVVEGAMLDADYWWRNVREPVRFADAVHTLLGAHECDVLVEIGPHPVLAPYLRRISSRRPDPVAIVSTMRRDDSGVEALDTAHAQMLAAGARIAWDAIFPGPGRAVPLPSYPWQRERHWIGTPDWWSEAPDARPTGHQLLGTRQVAPTPSWSQELDVGRLGWPVDHHIGENAVLPAAAFADMGLSAGREVLDGPVEILGFGIERALVLRPDDAQVRLRLHTALSQDGTITMVSKDGDVGDWVEHARGRVRRLLRAAPPALEVPAPEALCPQAAERFYPAIARTGLRHGPAFQSVTSLQAAPGAVVAAYSARIDYGEAHVAHPAVLDAAIQLYYALWPELAQERKLYLPVRIEKIRCWRPMPRAGFLHARAIRADALETVWDVSVTGQDGEVALELLGCRTRRYDGARPAEPARLTEDLWAAPLPGVLPSAAPSPLPAPRDVLAACPPEPAADHGQARLHERLLDLTAHFTAQAVAGLLPGQDVFTLDDLFAAGVAAEHTMLVQTLIRTAAERDVLTCPAPGRWRVATEPRAAELFREALDDLTGQSAALHIWGVSGRNLAAVLRGEQDARELLCGMPDQLAARFSESFPLLRSQRRLAGRLLQTMLADWPSGRPLRVLEVGAGTGTVTASLLAHLPPRLTRYTFTDVTTACFPQAQGRFAGFDFVDYRTLDLDADPTGQGFTPGSFDLVIAGHTLSARRDPASALRRVADLLNDGGHLLALEFHAPLVPPLFEVLGSRPLLGGEQWESLLDECGFTGTVQTSDLDDSARAAHSVILTARRPRHRPVQPPSLPDADASGRWLVTELDNGGSLATELSRLVGAEAVTAYDDPTNWAKHLSEGPLGVVLVAGAAGPSAGQGVEQTVRHLAVLRALATAARDTTGLNLWIVTEGTPNLPLAASGTGLWGAARTLGNEQPHLKVRRIALEGPDPRVLAERLAQELAAGSDEDEVLLTCEGRFVTRVRPRPEASDPSSDRPYTLTLHSTGLQHRLAWRETPVREPGEGEVTVRVEAAGLNYRDVLVATGLVPAPDPARPLGLECAGVVTAVGAGVTALAPGDRVAIVATGCLASHVTVRADQTIPIPADLGFAEAATMPTVYLTVHHGLGHLARLAPGETLLVHGAAGGVGLAALQYARQIGARVIGTAGTPAKRDLLHLLGVEHVLDSRSLDFVEQVKELTGGHGVDVVLNSLAGEALIRGLELVKPYGRFVELGKQDILADRSLPLGAFAANLAFFSVDVSALFTAPTHLTTTHLEAITEAIRTGRYRPLPHRTFPAHRIEEAFDCLQHSRHIGKAVITFDEPVRLPRPATPSLDPDATYLIVGGLGGFGAATARNLAARGARHVTLISRRGPSTDEARTLLEELHALDTTVLALAADAADPEAMREVFARIDSCGRRLGGVVHAAMVLDDAPLTDLTDERVRTVLTPKTTAARLLDQLTRERRLDFFVVYSSVAALAGNIRQAAYVAANLELEALVRDRRRAGLPGLAVQWGAISDAGYVHRAGRADEMHRLGLGHLTAHDAVAALNQLLGDAEADVVAVGHIEGDLLRRVLPRLDAPRTATMLPSSTQRDDDDRVRLRDALATATAEEAAAIMQDTLTGLLARVLQTTPEHIDRSRRLDQLGADSLLTVEFAAAIRQVFDSEVSAMEILSSGTLPAIAHRLLNRLGYDRPAGGEQERPT